MSSSMVHIVFGAVLIALLACSSVHGFKDQYFDMAESESQEYVPTVVAQVVNKRFYFHFLPDAFPKGVRMLPLALLDWGA